MTLIPGQFLGPYEVVGSVGAGGMGEVYRARDPRLGREVAIKIIPARLAGDLERLRRFEQEARAASALNHPNLLTVFDVGSDKDTPYLVTELLEGETLRQKLHEGPLPVRRTVELAGQVARGLAAAHERRIIHRDLKPENIFIMHDGRVKILDFGLAKLLPKAAASTQMTEAATASVGTDAGIVLGTVGYMSPEQVRGETADHRSDLFALGCILYEMISGKRAFQRQTAAETMTAILKEDPISLADLRPDTPPAFIRLIEHCLAKRPEDRFQTATDLAFALDSLSGLSSSASATVPIRIAGARRRGVSLLAIALLLLLLGALITIIWRSRNSGSAQTTITPTRIALALASDERLAPLHIPAFCLSPDGSQLAYTANRLGIQQLFLRKLDTLQGIPLPGTEGAHGSPFFSPDGQWIGFFAHGKLRKIAVRGGEPIALTDVPYG